MNTQTEIYFSTYDNTAEYYRGDLHGVRRWIAKRLSEKGIDGASLTQAHGVWRGEWEVSYRLMLIDANPAHVSQLVADIKRFYRQEAVMVVTSPVMVEFA